MKVERREESVAGWSFAICTLLGRVQSEQSIKESLLFRHRIERSSG